MSARPLGLIAALACASCASLPDDSRWRAPDDHGWDERGFLMIGQRELESGFFADGDRQLVIGLELAGSPPDSLLKLEMGFWASAEGGFGNDWLDSVFGTPNVEEDDLGDPLDEASTSTLEFSIGARKELPLLGGALRPYVGGGLSALQVRTWELENGAFDDTTDGSLGLYGHVGIRWLFENSGSIGFDLRAAEGHDVDLGPFGGEISSDYTQWALTFSFFL